MKNPKLLFAICTLFFVFGVSLMASAQPTLQGGKGNRKGKVNQLKIAYFTKELDLTTEQAEKFWPLYNEMNDKMREKKRAGRLATSDLKTNAATITEEKAKSQMQVALDAEIEQAKLRKEYTIKIAEVIGYKKTSKLLSLEAEFKRELLKRLATEEPEEKKSDD